MTVKLTLSVDEALVKKAKAYAKKRGTSVSKIFSESLAEKIAEPEEPEKIENLKKILPAALHDLIPQKKFAQKIKDKVQGDWKEQLPSELKNLMSSSPIPEGWTDKTDKEILAEARHERAVKKNWL